MPDNNSNYNADDALTVDDLQERKRELLRHLSDLYSQIAVSNSAIDGKAVQLFSFMAAGFTITAALQSDKFTDSGISKAAGVVVFIAVAWSLFAMFRIVQTRTYNASPALQLNPPFYSPLIERYVMVKDYLGVYIADFAGDQTELGSIQLLLQDNKDKSKWFKRELVGVAISLVGIAVALAS